MADEQRLRDVLGELIGVEGGDLDVLVDAIRKTAEEEAFDYVTGEGPIPSSAVDTRALRLRRLCHYAERPLTTREIEVVFRVSATSARSIDTRMRATYRLEMRALRSAVSEAMRQGARVTLYKDGTEDRYRVHLDSYGSYLHAKELLDVAGLTQGVEHPGDNTITFPILMKRRGGVDVNPLTDVLGLAEPR